MNLRQKKLSLKILKTKKEQANESVPEKYFLIVYRHTVKYMITACILIFFTVYKNVYNHNIYAYLFYFLSS